MTLGRWALMLISTIMTKGKQGWMMEEVSYRETTEEDNDPHLRTLATE